MEMMERMMIMEMTEIMTKKIKWYCHQNILVDANGDDNYDDDDGDYRDGDGDGDDKKKMVSPPVRISGC